MRQRTFITEGFNLKRLHFRHKIYANVCVLWPRAESTIQLGSIFFRLFCDMKENLKNETNVRTCPSFHYFASSGSCPFSIEDSPDCQRHCQMGSVLNGQKGFTFYEAKMWLWKPNVYSSICCTVLKRWFWAISLRISNFITTAISYINNLYILRSYMPLN